MNDAPTVDETSRPDPNGPQTWQPEALQPVREPRFPLPWWFLLVTGALWLFVGTFILLLRLGTAGLILMLIVVSMVLIAVLEIIRAVTVPRLRWLHAGFGVLLTLGACYAFYAPEATLLVAGYALAWFLLISGIVYIVEGFRVRAQLSNWWLLLVLGVLQGVLGAWALIEPDRTLVLLLVWTGITALSRGIGDIVVALTLRRAGSGA